MDYYYEYCNSIQKEAYMGDDKKRHGGLRAGAGRKKGSGKFGEPTKVIRVPESKVERIQSWLEGRENGVRDWTGLLEKSAFSVHQPANDSHVELPLFSHKVVAGFPSPADDYIEATLDLNEKLVRNKDATFLLVVEGDSMQKAGIQDGDILVVDRSVQPSDGKIVIAALDGELTVKRLSVKSTGTWLVPENDNYPPILVREEADMVIWGVVTATISQF